MINTEGFPIQVVSGGGKSGTFSGQFCLEDGSVGAPSLKFINSPTTGMYRSGADEIGFTTDGTLALTIGSDQVVTFEEPPTSPGSGSDTERWGAGASTGSATDAMAIGPNASTTGTNTSAIGVDASCVTAVGMALGNQTAITGIITGNLAIGVFSVASNASASVGHSCTASGLFSFALGTQASATANFALAVSGTASGASSFAIGSGSVAAQTNAFAVRTTTDAANQMALGGVNEIVLGPPTQTGVVATKVTRITDRTGTNVDGGNSTYYAGRGTGTGTPGTFQVYAYRQAASGTTQHTAEERLRFSETETVFNDPGNDADFRVEGLTDTNLFFVDASTDRVGVGTNAPAELFDVDGLSRAQTFTADGDVGSGVAATNRFTGVTDTPTTDPGWTTSSTVDMNAPDSYIKIYIGTQAYVIPAWVT